MAADEKTIYDLVTEYFVVDKDYDVNDTIDIPPNYKANVLPKNKDFIYIGVKRTKDLSQDSPTRERSNFGKVAGRHVLKFHISIPEDNEILHKRAVDVLMPILMKQGVNFKFLKKGLKMSEIEGEEEQAGRDITIYTNTTLDKKLDDWTRFITEITTALVQHQIPPGYCVTGKGEHEINGCNYVTYRYERGDPPKDPVQIIHIDVPNQIMSTQYRPKTSLVI